MQLLQRGRFMVQLSTRLSNWLRSNDSQPFLQFVQPVFSLNRVHSILHKRHAWIHRLKLSEFLPFQFPLISIFRAISSVMYSFTPIISSPVIRCVHSLKYIFPEILSARDSTISSPSLIALMLIPLIVPQSSFSNNDILGNIEPNAASNIQLLPFSTPYRLNPFLRH